MGLIHFDTFHTVPNVTKKHHKFYLISPTGEKIEIDIPIGSYAINDLTDEINRRIRRYFKSHHVNVLGKDLVNLYSNPNTHKIQMFSEYDIDFTPADSLADLLGFERRVYKKDEHHTSSHIVRITPVNAIRVHCNITVGTFHNGEPSHVIHEFYPAVAPGFKILEIPKNVIYLPISTLHIENISLKLLDENDQPIDFREEDINIRLHLKRVPWQ